jgi:hypothetical protein
MALGPENVEPAGRDDLLFVFFAVGPNFFEDLELACIRQILFPVQNLFEHEVGIAAQDNVSAAARHIRGDGDGALASGLGDDLGFSLMLLGVEDVVFHAVPAQESGESLRFFDGNRADQDGLTALVAFLDLFDDRGELFFLGSVDDIRVI